MRLDVDVAIVGSGFAGSLTALAILLLVLLIRPAGLMGDRQ